MPKTRKQEKQESSVEKANDVEPLEQKEEASKDTTVPESNAEKEESDATVKARERQARFKALQARAVSGRVCGSSHVCFC